MATNNILPFCPTDTGTNLLSQSDYSAATDRTSGNKPGVASAKLNNKAIRQSALIASQVAQYLADKTGSDVIDDGTTASLLGLLNSALKPKNPVIQAFTTGSGTWNKSYVFTIASGSATVGATYTNNGITYTIVGTVASATQVIARGSGAPTVSGTLTKASGTGDATLTFYAVAAPLFLHVRMVGGGGGGGGSGSGGGYSAGGNAGNSTFGTTLLVANGGNFGGGGGGPGGTASLGTGPTGTALQGGSGQSGNGWATQAGAYGGSGAASPFGGAGGSGSAAIANTGSGGGGGGGQAAAVFSGGGGSAGGYVDAVITSPSATYAYAVGAGGTAGTAGTNGFAGGAGGSGYIEVTEFYQ